MPHPTDIFRGTMGGVSKPILVLSGPTASGKSTLAVDVAVALQDASVRAEIINADSMLVYRGMDIGTAKPDARERRGIVHHLVDILDVHEVASVADFQCLARAAIAEVHARDGVPIVVGGSALYLRAITDDFEFPGTDPDVRARWDAELHAVGPQALHDRLAAISPDAAAGIEPLNGRRIVRALEVIELTGTFTPVLPSWRYLLGGVRQYGLDIPRPELDERIAARVHHMWDDGLEHEVVALIGRGLREGLTASRAIGYAQALAYLDGELTRDQAIEQTIIATRRFARKQLGWFRRDHRIEWLPAGDPANTGRIVAATLDAAEGE